MSIVLELQKEAMKSDKDILTILRMALVVATKLDLNDFKEWINKELKGYQSTDELPAYRIIDIDMVYSDKNNHFMKFVLILIKKNQHMGTYPVLNSISSLNHMINTKKNNLPPDPALVMIDTFIQNVKIDHEIDRTLPDSALENINVKIGHKIEKTLPNSALEDIIEQVRTKILEWTLILENNGILGSELTFTIEEKKIAKTNSQIHNYITNNNIYGDNNNTQVQQNSDNSKQTIKQEFDYESVLKLLLSIQNQSDDQKFITAFGDKTEEIKSIINETIELVNQKDEPTKIKTCLNKLKDITQNVAGNLLATGIYNEILQLIK